MKAEPSDASLRRALNRIAKEGRIERAKWDVTEKMVNEGVRVLRKSGFLRDESSADALVVRDVLVAALACKP
jgi:hypothetical protein